MRAQPGSWHFTRREVPLLMVNWLVVAPVCSTYCSADRVQIPGEMIVSVTFEKSVYKGIPARKGEVLSRDVDL